MPARTLYTMPASRLVSIFYVPMMGRFFNQHKEAYHESNCTTAIRPMKHNDWTVICNLWGAVVGNSGVMKSPTLGAALSPVKKLQAAAFEIFNMQIVDYESQIEVAKLLEGLGKNEAKKKLKGDKNADVKSLLKADTTDSKLIPSLALINHLCDTQQGAVSEKSLMRAIAIGEYLESHARRIYSYATRPDIDAAKTLLKRLASGKLSSPFTGRDIYRAGWAGLENPSKAQSAINLLLEYHHLKEEEIPTGGRPSMHYHWVKAGAV